MSSKLTSGNAQKLTSEKALIWRIIHLDNLFWILDNGLHCASSAVQAVDYKPIGSNEIINKRKNKFISLAPGGSLSDDIPFYFTPFSPMMFNIHTGRGVLHYPNDEIIILVSSLHKIKETGIKFLFSDRHAYCEMAMFFNNLDDLPKLVWNLWQQRNFARDPEDPEKIERYQAEALVHKYLPVKNLIAIICFTNKLELKIKQQLNEKGLNLTVLARPGWYFE